MTLYADSSALIKLYVPEENSAEVEKVITRTRQPLPLSSLHKIEMETGLRLKVFRKEASATTVEAAIRHIASDIATGVYYRPSFVWEDAFEAAGSLSLQYAAILGIRSLDILHVATAVTLRAQVFLTFDKRQQALARKAGLRVIVI